MTHIRVPARVGGDEIFTPDTYTVLDPTTELPIAEVAECGTDLAGAAAEAAAAASPAFADLPLFTRKAVLALTADRLDARREELIELAVADTGARTAVAAEVQVGRAIDRLRYWATQGEDRLVLPSPDQRDGIGATIERTPVGVIACISPYNFPLLAMVGKAAPALFAGNTVVLKPAPQDPLLVAALSDALTLALRELNAPAGAVNLVLGSGAEAGAALVAHPAVGAVSFTGSTGVGIDIYRNAAPGMKRLLLELGGKGAVIVREDADVDQVATAVSRTWTVQAGQVCLTPARILADAKVHDALVDRLLTLRADLRHGDPRHPETTVGPLISAAQRETVTRLVDTAEHEGCEVHRKADLPEIGFHHPATLVTGCSPENTLMREEAFGPVLCVMRTSGDDEAVEAANSTHYGLSDYIFSDDTDYARRLARRLRSAQIGINTVARHPDAPFGGNKASGLGRSGATFALDSYTDLRTVTRPERP